MPCALSDRYTPPSTPPVCNRLCYAVWIPSSTVRPCAWTVNLTDTHILPSRPDTLTRNSSPSANRCRKLWGNTFDWSTLASRHIFFMEWQILLLSSHLPLFVLKIHLLFMFASLVYSLSCLTSFLGKMITLYFPFIFIHQKTGGLFFMAWGRMPRLYFHREIVTAFETIKSNVHLGNGVSAADNFQSRILFAENRFCPFHVPWLVRQRNILSRMSRTGYILPHNVPAVHNVS